MAKMNATERKAATEARKTKLADTMEHFLTTVRASASVSGSRRRAFTDALAAGHKEADLAMPFKAVWLVETLGLVVDENGADRPLTNREAVAVGERIIALKGYKADKPADDAHRTHAQEKAYAAARNAYTLARNDAGLKEPPKPRAPHRNEQGESAGREDAVPTAKTPAEFGEIVGRMAVTLDAIGRKNAAHLTGSRTHLLQEAVKALKALADADNQE